MTFSRMLTNLCSDRLTESRDFYISLLGFEVNYDSAIGEPKPPGANHQDVRAVGHRSPSTAPAQRSHTSETATFAVINYGLSASTALGG